MNDLNLSFLGLGVMGYPMAGHLASYGFNVCVYNRTTSKAEQWVSQYGGSLAQTPAQAAMGADFVFCCVGNDSDLRSVTIEDAGAFSTIKAGAIFIDHTTASAKVARELYAIARRKKFAFIDAPVSGGQAGAEKGVLSVMAGGDKDVFERSQRLISCYARTIMLMGKSGAGQLTKMVNQICIAGLIQSLSEGLAFGVNAGLDCARVFEVISQGAASSWQMINRHETMLENEFEFGFAVDWMRKDLGLCMDESIRNGSELPVTKLVDRYYAEIQSAGGGRLDSSSLVTRLHRKDLQ